MLSKQLSGINPTFGFCLGVQLIGVGIRDQSGEAFGGDRARVPFKINSLLATPRVIP